MAEDTTLHIPLQNIDAGAMDIGPHTSTHPPLSNSQQESTKHEEEISTGPILGQLSFAPATQTTVVTTTTTTTTKFPPILMPPPRRTRHLDSKQFPLANTPTPPSLRNITFEVDGKKTRFSEADDATLALEQVGPTWLVTRYLFPVADFYSSTKRQKN